MSFKRKPYSNLGEAVMTSFILIVTFVVLIAWVVGSLLNQMSSSAEMINQSDRIEEVFGAYNYTLIDPDTGYSVTSGDVSDEMVYPTEAPFIFTDDGGDAKYVQVIRDNVNYDPGSTDVWTRYSDFISVQRNKGTPGEVGSKWLGASIPFTSFAADYDNRTNVSSIGFMLGNMNDTLFIETGSGFLANLWANNFTLYYGWSFFRTENIDFWGAIGTVMFAKIPGVDPIVDFIIKAFMYSTIIFLVFTMVTRIIPFLGGG
jgi:hypothetical protein